LLGFFVGGFSIAGTAMGDTVETTAEPGSPGATTTIDGKQIPPPPDKHFGGKIERNVMQSTPYWPPRVVPPKDAPNILLIITDDAGYGVSSTFGGVIPTPAMDRIADEGLRYTQGATTTKWAWEQFRSFQPGTPATTA
jgi:arylsulfatase